MAHAREMCTRGHRMAETRRYYPNGDSYCVVCKQLRAAREPVKQRTYEQNRRYKLQSTYGLTSEAYEALLTAQDGHCAICLKPPRGLRNFHIDHDHLSGIVRGLLCHHCNTGLGLFDDSPDWLDAAKAYLERIR